MPPFPPPLRLTHSSHGQPLQHPRHDADQSSHVVLSSEAEGALAGLHSTITNEPDPGTSELGKYLQDDQLARTQAFPLSVCFKSVSTYGLPGGIAPVRTLRDAIWRTLTFQDIYEWTLKRMIYPQHTENGQALIRDFSGVVRNGEMML